MKFIPLCIFLYFPILTSLFVFVKKIYKIYADLRGKAVQIGAIIFIS